MRYIKTYEEIVNTVEHGYYPDEYTQGKIGRMFKKLGIDDYKLQTHEGETAYSFKKDGYYFLLFPLGSLYCGLYSKKSSDPDSSFKGSKTANPERDILDIINDRELSEFM